MPIADTGGSKDRPFAATTRRAEAAISSRPQSPHFKNYQGAKLIAALRDTIDMLDFMLPVAF